MSEYGRVYIMGVGPGDHKLITMKAAECIRKADVIVYDRLVSTKILSFAKAGAELIYVGKLPELHAVPQEGINEILVRKALEGKSVARVKGGDPFVFGRGGEEAEALYEKGLGFEIVPGVTSAIAVPAYAGIPVTHRNFCSSLHIITGHERPDKKESSIDYEVLAQTEGTLVFLMGVKNLQEISARLIACGKDKMTPAAVIEKGTTCEQRVVTGILEDIAGKVAEAGITSPAVTVIGKVVELRERINWFPKGRLSGKRVIVTRSRAQASDLVERIEELGGETLEFPTIKIAEPLTFAPLDEALENLETFKWLVFTSANGVSAFFHRMRIKGIDIRTLFGIKLCAIGTATAEELNKIGLMVEYMPEEYTSGDLMEGLAKRISEGEKVLLVRAELGSKELSEGLAGNNIDFADIAVYRTLPDRTDKDGILDLIEGGKADYITFTSSSTVNNFLAAIGKENIGKLSKIKTVCIGPITAKTALDAGLTVHATAGEYTINGLVNKLVEISEDEDGFD